MLTPLGTILYHYTGPNMLMLMHALCITISSVPSKYSAFCNYFRRGRRGLLRKITTQSQIIISTGPVSIITSRPDTKPLAQKTNTYLNILCMTKKSTLYNVSNQFILMSPNTNKKEQLEQFLLFRSSAQVYFLINEVCQAEQSLSLSPTSTIPWT